MHFCRTGMMDFTQHLWRGTYRQLLSPCIVPLLPSAMNTSTFRAQSKWSYMYSKHYPKWSEAMRWFISNVHIAVPLLLRSTYNFTIHQRELYTSEALETATLETYMQTGTSRMFIAMGPGDIPLLSLKCFCCSQLVSLFTFLYICIQHHEHMHRLLTCKICNKTVWKVI